MKATSPKHRDPRRQTFEEICSEEEFIPEGNHLLATAHHVAETILERIKAAIHKTASQPQQSGPRQG